MTQSNKILRFWIFLFAIVFSGMATAAPELSLKDIAKSSASETINSPDAESAIDVEIDRRFNELKRELLDHRAGTIDWWLSAIGLFLAFFAIFVSIVAIWGYRKIKEIENEARQHLEEIKKHGKEAEGILSGMTSESYDDKTKENEKAVQEIQNNPEASILDKAIARALSFQSAGEIENAIQQWQAIAGVAGEESYEVAARAWFSVGYLFNSKSKMSGDMKTGSLESSIDAYDQAIRIKPDYADAYNNRGDAKHSLGRHVEAVADHDEAIRINPELAVSYYNRGLAKQSLGRYAEAIADDDQAIRLKPDFVEAYFNRGNAKHSLGQSKQAIVDYDKAIRLKPDYAKAYNNLGNAKLSLRQPEQAIVDYDEAIRVKPDYAEAYYNLGNVKHSLGQSKQAIVDYDKAIRIKPDYAKAYRNRGHAKAALGQNEEAAADIEKAKRLDPTLAE